MDKEWREHPVIVWLERFWKDDTPVEKWYSEELYQQLGIAYFNKHEEAISFWRKKIKEREQEWEEHRQKEKKRKVWRFLLRPFHRHKWKPLMTIGGERRMDICYECDPFFGRGVYGSRIGKYEKLS